MILKDFLETIDFDSQKKLPDNELLTKAELFLETKFGPQLTEYLLNYGYLGFDDIELYGINSKQKIDSDMIKQTIYLHKHFKKTTGYIALENCGESLYALIDCQDQISFFNLESNTISNSVFKLNDYIISRFQSA